MAGFDRQPLGEILGKHGYIRGPFGSSLVRGELLEKGIPVYEQQHAITGGREFRFFISEEKLKELSRFQVKPNDLIISCSGTIGRISVIQPHDPIGIISQALLILRPQTERVSPEFLYYFLSTREGQHALTQASHGSVQVNIAPRAVVELIEVPVPPKPEQRAIAHILRTLDDKIELNRRMNETLEAMARAIFKSWFVDFDPVRAKAEGRDPGLPQPLADLFPDSFEDSELGEIPAGWTISSLGQVVQQRVERCTPSTETAAMPYVPIDCISSKSLFLTDSKPGEEAQSSLTRFYKGDILFGAMRPYFHKVCIAPFDGTTRTTAFVLSPKNKEDFAYATFLMHDPETIDYATRHSTGSTIPYAVWLSSLADMPICLPPPVVRAALEKIVRPMLERIPERYFEHRTLTKLRDVLLPKLISGELRVKDVHRIIGEATP